MSKSILVIDTPGKCIHCPLLNGVDECIVQDDDANFNASDSWDELIKWCPLRKLPEKDDFDDLYDEYYTGYSNGWNDCLREIIGQPKEDY